MAKPEVGSIPLSRFGILVAQLESIAASARQQPPDALLCFDLLSELVTSIDEEPKESILQWQRKCEDALYSLLTHGARRPVRRLASVAMVKVIGKGDGISIYSRASSLQGWLVDGKRSEPLSCAGAAQCLGELYSCFGRRITSGLVETTHIVSKLMKFHDDFVRQDALQMLENALEGSAGNGPSAAYSEAFRIIVRVGCSDKSYVVRLAGARCLKAFANIGGPGLGTTEMETSISQCVKALEDPVSSVRDAFAEALGAFLALAINPEVQVKERGKNSTIPAKKFEDGLQKHLLAPFTRASGARMKDLHVGIALSWVFLLQVIHLKYRLPESELQSYGLQALELLQGNASNDAHALACVLYILRVGVADQMTEPMQRSFLVLLAKKLEPADYSPPVGVAALRILSHLLATLGEVSVEFKEVLDDTVVAALSNPSAHVRIEAALTIRTLAEIDPTCVGGLISYGVTTLHALRESAAAGKGNDLNIELDSLHGQATVLAALVSISPKLVLGYPARLPKSVFDVLKKMLTEFSRLPAAATVEKVSGWLLLASLISSMPKEELNDQVFDILLLWAGPFVGDPEFHISRMQDLSSEIGVLSVAIEALMAFIRSFVTPTSTSNAAVFLQPVLTYLSGALSYISTLRAKELKHLKPALDLLTIRTLMAYRSLSDPMSYIREHSQILQICTTLFSDPSKCEESSCLRFLLDKRDACLGPWTPGRDWFEDELRAFDGGNDGILPCVWDDQSSSFPRPESLSRMLVNQKLLVLGIIFACQDSDGKMQLLNKIDQCLKAGKKQPWYMNAITNACVGLLAGLKSVSVIRPHQLDVEILGLMQSIFQGILAEAGTSSAQRRASSEGLGLLARLGNDIFTARMMRSLLGDLGAATDPNYSGSIAFSLGCIHRCAGGMALSTMVPATVTSISSLAKSSNAGLQLWSLHALLLTIEAAGLSYVSQVQGTLYLAIEVLLTEENGLADLRQEIGRLINAIVGVLGPELAPGSTFFARCKSLIAEISSSKATSALLESVRFTQQLVLFAPQAVPVHSHIQNLLPTLFSRQPILRHLTASTLRHLIEKDPGAVGNEQIEEDLFSMLDEETDSEIASLVRASMTRLLYASCPSRPSRWLMIFRKMVLASSTRGSAIGDVASAYGHSSGASEDDVKLFYGEDDEGTISSSSDFQVQGSHSGLSISNRRSALLRYRTRVFAAECLSQLPIAVGTDPVHFDLGLARMKAKEQNASTDCLVFHLQEMISLSYQVSTGQFEGMQPIGVKLLSVIVDKFGNIPDPDLPEHILLEQYQAQLVSAVRSSITTSSGPLLLEAGLQLATKILTSSILSGDRVALSRMFSLISRPLNDIGDLYYPSFAEWVACKIKVRLLAAHASIKCFVYSSLIEQNRTSEEYLQLIPQFSSSSNILGKYWINILKDYSYICFSLQSKNKYKPFLDGIQSPLVSSKVQECLDEAWPLILKAIVLDAAPVNRELRNSSAEHAPENDFISGCIMVRLEPKDFHFLWGLAALILFQQNQSLAGKQGKKMLTHFGVKGKGDIPIQGHCFAPSDIPLLVIQSLSKKLYFCEEYLTVDLCREFLEVLLYADAEKLWTTLVALMLSQMVQSCPVQFLEVDEFFSVATELYLKCLYATLKRDHPAFQNNPSTKDIISELSIAAETIASQMKDQGKVIMSYLSICYECLKGTSTESCISKTVAFLWNLRPLFQKHFQDDGVCGSETLLQAWASILVFLSQDCIKKMHFVENKFSDSFKFLAKILSACLEEVVALARLVHEHHSDKEHNQMILMPVYKVCIKSFQDIFCDPNLQVQLIGVHVLKSVAQRELADVSTGKSHLFFLSIIGEISEDLFLLIQNKLQGNITRDSMVLIEEYLRLLFVDHTLSQASSYSSAVTRLLLEALVMVFYAERHHQPQTEAKTIASRLLSHVVQMPTSAILVKELMLSMPPIRRQQLQDMIRASIGQSQLSSQTKAINPPPIVTKLNPQTDPRATIDQENHASVVADTDKTDTNEEEEDEDWDAFQSLPANHPSESISDHNDDKEPKTASSDDGPSSQSPAAKSGSESFSDYVDDTGIEVTSAGKPIGPETDSRLVFEIDHGENIGVGIASTGSPTSPETDGDVTSNTEGPEVLDEFSAVQIGDQMVSACDEQQMVQTTCSVDEISVNDRAEELNNDSYDLSLSSNNVEEAGNHH